MIRRGDDRGQWNRADGSLQVKVKLAIASITLVFTMCVALYETFEHLRYFSWRRAYEAGTDWHGNVTIPSQNKALVWEYRPNSSYRELRINRFGFRDRNYETGAKPVGVYRLGFVGDSVTLGLGVDEESIYVRQFERRANAAMPVGLRVQTLNFGIDGYNALQVSELLRTRVALFEPDHVTYVMSLNDFNLGASTGEKLGYFRKPRSFFLLNFKTLYTRLSVIGKPFLTDTELHRWWFHMGEAPVFSAIDEMRRWLATRHVQFDVAVVPIFLFSESTFESYPLADVHAEIRLKCEKMGIRAIDLLEAFRQRGAAPRETALDIWHPNAKGHMVIAEQLHTRLTVPRQ